MVFKHVGVNIVHNNILMIFYLHFTVHTHKKKLYKRIPTNFANPFINPKHTFLMPYTCISFFKKCKL
jgi:hypothetical protein